MLQVDVKKEKLSKGEMILTDSLKVKNSIIMWQEKQNFKETARNRQVEKFGTNYGAILSPVNCASRARVLRAVHWTIFRTPSF
jgi:hypothetical protein